MRLLQFLLELTNGQHLNDRLVNNWMDASHSLCGFFTITCLQSPHCVESTMIAVLLLLVCIFYMHLCDASKLSSLFSLKRLISKTDKKPTAERVLLPNLPPHEDNCYVLEFISDGSDYCIQMEPVVQRLEKDLGIKVRKINISKRQDFVKLYDCVGGNECGTVPFFYNRRTAQAICGPTPYQNLKKLATGNPTHFFNDAPQSSFDKQEYDPRRQRGVGFTDFLSEKVFRRGNVDRPRKKGSE